MMSLFSVGSVAQSPVSARLRSGVDLGMAYTKDHYNPSIAYFQLINVTASKLLSVGWTARLGAFYGDNLDYYTAPARLTRGKTGFAALGAPLVVDNLDTVRFDYITAASLNLGVRAQINLGPVEVGGSADLIGLTFGRWRTGRYRSSTGEYTVTGASGGDTTLTFARNVEQRAYPTRFNARLLGDNDRGSLSTEVYARLYISKRIALKAGYQWLTSEATLQNRNTQDNNNRFRHRAGLGYVALTFPVL